jgi:pimeloyl-ACP methyl ester carboxylesterase
MADRPTPPWADQIPEGGFISCAPTYQVGKLFDRFEKDWYTAGDGTKMKYWFFDPTEHGFPKGKTYPVLIFFHGASNALEGDICINYTGAELYASDAYQKSMGGAYILIPVANEYRNEEGRTQGTWSTDYVEPTHELIQSVLTARGADAGLRFLFGNSAGARFVFRIADAYPEAYDVLIPVGTTDVSTDERLRAFERCGIWLFYAIGRRDEFNPYETKIAPQLPRLATMKNCFTFVPDWVYNGDGGIASIFAGIEMGQHCLMNGVQANLMFDDGTPMYGCLPEGMTGWIAGVLKERGNER